MTVKRLERELDQRELIEWIAFEQMEPFGTAVEDNRFGTLLAHQNGGHPSDYFPGYDAADIEETLKYRTERDKAKAATDMEKMIVELQTISAHNAEFNQ